MGKANRLRIEAIRRGQAMRFREIMRQREAEWQMLREWEAVIRMSEEYGGEEVAEVIKELGEAGRLK